MNYEGLGKQLVVAYIGQFGNCKTNTNYCLVSKDEDYSQMNYNLYTQNPKYLNNTADSLFREFPTNHRCG